MLIMKNPIRILIFHLILFSLKINSQTCYSSFLYTVNPNGVVTLSNTSVPASSSVTTLYTWYTSNGLSYSTTALTQTASFTFTINGNYIIGLSMFSPSSTCSADTFKTVSVQLAGCPLIAQETHNNLLFFTPTATFVNQSTGTISSSSYTWDFGDGSTSNLPNPPPHTFANNGIYGYTLTVSNSPTCTSVSTDFKNSGFYSPTKVCSYPISISHTISAPGVVNFSVNGIVSYDDLAFNFTDHLLELYNLTPTHIFFNGTYTPNVAASIHSSCNFYDTLAPITITNNPCNANSAYSYTSGTGGIVQFSVTAPTFSNVNYLWNFGDGMSATGSNPTHTFASAGIYSVNLMSYNTAYTPYNTNINSNYYYLPCADTTIKNVNITGIPCIANSSFTLMPTYPQHTYWIIPAFPYNVTMANWSWGDGNTSNTLYASHTYTAAGTYDVCLTLTTSCGGTSSYCSTQFLSKGATGDMLYVTVKDPEIIAGISNPEKSVVAINLFPNPASDFLNIESNSLNQIQLVSIYDSYGKLVDELNFIQDYNDKITIYLNEYSNGLYFIKIKIKEELINSKFIIQR